MTILIFQSQQSLVEYFGSSGTCPSVYDLSRSEGMRKLYPERMLTPAPFSTDQKEKILDEFVEIISELGGHNSFSVPWLCHPVSEKNNLIPGNLFEQLTDFLKFASILSTVKERPLAFFTPDTALIRNIGDYLTEKKIDFRITGLGPDERDLFSFFKDEIRNFYRIMKRLSRIQSRFMASRQTVKKLDKSATYTLIRTWFDSRSPALLKKNEDVYFGKLPGFLQNRGHRILYFGDCIDGFEQIADILTENQGFPVILQSAYLHGFDFIKAVFFQLNIGKKIRLKSGLKLFGFGVDCVFKNYVKAQNKNQHIQTNYLTFTAAKKILEELNVFRIYMPFENYAWEKLTWKAVKSVGVDTELISFQHSQIALNSTMFFMGKKEFQSHNLPDKILTPGSVNRDFLVNKKNYPKELLRVGCALRHDYSLSSESAERKKSKRVLVQLWTFDKSIRLVNLFLSDRSSLKNYHIYFNPHPCHPMEKLMPHLDIPLMENHTVADSLLSENMRASDVVVYHGTTTCLDALAHGIPVVHVEFDDFLSPDPLFDFHEFKWTVYNPEELAEVMDEIYMMNDADYYAKQKSGFDFVRKYFDPVNEAGLAIFLTPEGDFSFGRGDKS